MKRRSVFFFFFLFIKDFYRFFGLDLNNQVIATEHFGISLAIDEKQGAKRSGCEKFPQEQAIDGMPLICGVFCPKSETCIRSRNTRNYATTKYANRVSTYRETWHRNVKDERDTAARANVFSIAMRLFNMRDGQGIYWLITCWIKISTQLFLSTKGNFRQVSHTTEKFSPLCNSYRNSGSVNSNETRSLMNEVAILVKIKQVAKQLQQVILIDKASGMTRLLANRG